MQEINGGANVRLLVQKVATWDPDNDNARAHRPGYGDISIRLAVLQCLFPAHPLSYKTPSTSMQSFERINRAERQY